MNDKHFDIIIIGAGPVGASLALALTSLPLRIAILEAKPSSPSVSADSDSRALALTHGSMQILSTIGIWPALATHATPIAAVHISDRGHFGMTRIKAQDEGVNALGYVIPAHLLAQNLQTAIQTVQNLKLFCPAKVKAITPDVKLTVQKGDEAVELFADLIIAADGTHSTVRELLAIETEIKDYEQSALTTTLTLARNHHNIAYERFLEQGALAMLPLTDSHCGCIWTGPSNDIDSLITLTDNQYLTKLQQQFGYRLGKLIAVGKRHVHSLKMLRVKYPAKQNVVVIGNAAHTIHPIAAQGFNLGLADVAALAQLIKQAVSSGKTLKDPALLEEYCKLRQQNVNWVMRFTNNLTQLFGVDFLPLTLARNSSLLALDFIPPLKRRLARRLMNKHWQF